MGFIAIKILRVGSDYLSKDPARKLKTPTSLRETDKTVLTWKQLRAALAELGPRDRILLKLGMTNALRPGELFAFRWSSLDAERSKLHIRKTIYKGKLRPWGKTKGILTAIPITPEQVRELEAWHRTSKYAAPEDFIFAGRDGNFMDPGNYRKRVLDRLGKQLGLPKLTFQVIVFRSRFMLTGPSTPDLAGSSISLTSRVLSNQLKIRLIYASAGKSRGAEDSFRCMRSFEYGSIVSFLSTHSAEFFFSSGA